MKQSLITLVFLTLTSLAIGQIAGQSFDKLPENNEMVEKSLEIFDWLRNGDLEKLKQEKPEDKDWFKEIQSSVDFFKDGISEDTIMIEHYLGEKSTLIEYRVNCDKIEKGLTYWLKLKSDGVAGSMKNFRFWVERDMTFLMIRNEILNIPVPNKKK